MDKRKEKGKKSRDDRKDRKSNSGNTDGSVKRTPSLPSPFSSNLFDDLFGGFGGFGGFGSIDQEMQEMQDLFEIAQQGQLEDPTKIGRYVYGYRMHVGPDGVPHMEEFGNARPEEFREFRRMFAQPRMPLRIGYRDPGDVPQKQMRRSCPAGVCTTGVRNDVRGSSLEAGVGPAICEPYTDLIEHNNSLSITIEMPGVNKENIDLQLVEDTLEVKAKGPNREYYKKVKLPEGIKKRTLKASYKNGILDITMKRAGKGTGSGKSTKKKGKTIKID